MRKTKTIKNKMKNRLLVERFQKLAGIKEDNGQYIGLYTNDQDEEFTLYSKDGNYSITGSNTTGNYDDNDVIYFSSVLDDSDQAAGYDNTAADFIDPSLESALGNHRIFPEIGKDGGEYFVAFKVSLGFIKKYFKEQ